MPTHARYGLFFDDPRNLGYSESCTATDAGRPIVLAQPGFFMTSSPTENLDLVFSTGSGHLIIDCQSSAQQVATKPVPNLAIILLGGGATLLLGIAAAVLAILWATRVGAHPQPQPHNYGPPQSPAASI